MLLRLIMSFKKHCRFGTKSYGKVCIKNFRKTVTLIAAPAFVNALRRVRDLVVRRTR